MLRHTNARLSPDEKRLSLPDSAKEMGDTVEGVVGRTRALSPSSAYQPHSPPRQIPALSAVDHAIHKGAAR